MLNWLRNVIELIGSGDPWAWEVEAEYDAAIDRPRASADNAHRVRRPAHGLVSSAGEAVRGPLTSAA